MRANHYLFAVILMCTGLVPLACQQSEELAGNGNKTVLGLANQTWTLNGVPVLLAGASQYDNPFQLHPSEPLLDDLQQAGGNFVRCTLSSRDLGNVWPYNQQNDARFDLTTWNDSYWVRLDKYLKAADERQIVVLLELWDVLDFFGQGNAWQKNPFNPPNNLQYTAAETGFEQEIPQIPCQGMHPLFTHIPSLKPGSKIYPHLQRYVDRLLERVFRYEHVILHLGSVECTGQAWAEHWATYIHEKAEARGRKTWVTASMDASFYQADPKQPTQADSIVTKLSVFRNQFDWATDFSDLQLLAGDVHYNALLNLYREVPMFMGSKIYGGETNLPLVGYYDEASLRFWRTVFAGGKALLFFHPPLGYGLNDLAIRYLQSLQNLSHHFQPASAAPAPDILLERQAEEAYALADPTGNLAVFFPACAEVKVRVDSKNYEINWLDLLGNVWDLPYQEVAKEGTIALKSPCEGCWIAVLKPRPEG
jgi:hypothetical protein